MLSLLPKGVKKKEGKYWVWGTVLDQGLQLRKITKYLMGFNMDPEPS